MTNPRPRSRVRLFAVQSETLMAGPRFQFPTTSPRDRYAAGKQLRQRVPRQAHAPWSVKKEARLDPMHEAERGRLTRLLSEKYRRMRVSPFAFFRGAAALMAADLAKVPNTGLTVQLCGDAHVRNLAPYAPPPPPPAFPFTHFDEAMPGPWEWDVKLVATSLVLAGEEAGQSSGRCEESVRLFVRAYRTYLHTFATMRFATLARYLITRRPGQPLLDAVFRDAERVTPIRNLRKLTVERRKRIQFHDRPPLLEHVSPRVSAEVVNALRG